jgi:hypothetical protein
MLTRSRRALAALLASGLAGLLGGCQETTTPVVGVYHPTLVSVDPSKLSGGVPCANAGGALRAYVATVFDVEYEADGSLVTASAPDLAGTGGAPDQEASNQAPDLAGFCPADATPGTAPRSKLGFALPSSGPTDCRTPVAFSRVVDGHRYRAEVDGYDRDGLVPLVAGAPIMVDPATGDRVAPRWKWRCGDACPENALAYLNRPFSECTLEPGSEVPNGSSTVLVTLDGVPGVPACGTDAGSLDHYSVSYGNASGVTTSIEAACGEQIELDDVPERGTLKLSVLAYEAGNAEATWGTTCTATLIPGLTVNAGCAPLIGEGALDLDPAVALGALGYDCEALAALPGELRLTLEPSDPSRRPIYVDQTTCGRNVRISNLAQGAAKLTATLLSGPTELGRATCGATIVPASVVPAECGVEP